MPNKEKSNKGSEALIDRATDWVNDRLLPFLGPPALGPYGPESTQPMSEKTCPICQRPMGEHVEEISASTGHHYLHHPGGDSYGVMDLG